MSENVGSSTPHNSKGLHGLYKENFTFYLLLGPLQGEKKKQNPGNGYDILEMVEFQIFQ
jgi:hypothetical protein